MSFRSYVGGAIGEYSNEHRRYAADLHDGRHPRAARACTAPTSPPMPATRSTPGTRNGDTYVNGELSLDPATNRIFMTIWDGGGMDTYDLSQLHERSQTIDLTPGGCVDPLRRAAARRSGTGNFAKRQRLQRAAIPGRRAVADRERLGRGRATTTILGNAASNGIDGGGGNDTLSGGAGDDMIDGGGGNDLIYGGPGRDDITRRRRQRHALRQQRRRPDGRRRRQRHLLCRRPFGVRLRVRGPGRRTR